MRFRIWRSVLLTSPNATGIPTRSPGLVAGATYPGLGASSSNPNGVARPRGCPPGGPQVSRGPRKMPVRRHRARLRRASALPPPNAHRSIPDISFVPLDLMLTKQLPNATPMGLTHSYSFYPGLPIEATLGFASESRRDSAAIGCGGEANTTTPFPLGTDMGGVCTSN